MSDDASTTDTCPDVSAPTEQHALFAPFVGHFTAASKFWMGPGEPFESSGRMTNELDLGGRFLKQTYTGDPIDDVPEGGPPLKNFEGRGWWGCNTATGAFEGVWIDTASTMMQTEVGHVDDSGRRWEMVGHLTNPADGSPMTKRSVIEVVSNDRHRMTTYFQWGDQPEAKVMEIEFTRA